jgi:molybdopterin-guanine dinucleotide biosynthesis protein B
MIPIISVVGRSNSGKTTYLEKLITECKQRGYKVAVIKHHHQDFDIDKPGKDTWRHTKAGADVVCLVSPHKMAMIKTSDQELSLDYVAGFIDNVDIIFTEGYKQETKYKIEVYRQAAGHAPLGVKPELLAVVSDTVLYEGIPHFTLDDPGAMTNFLEVNVLNKDMAKA